MIEKSLSSAPVRTESYVRTIDDEERLSSAAADAAHDQPGLELDPTVLFDRLRKKGAFSDVTDDDAADASALAEPPDAQPRLTVVHADDRELEDDDGLIELSPAEETAALEDDWPWLASLSDDEDDRPRATGRAPGVLDSATSSDKTLSPQRSIVEEDQSLSTDLIVSAAPIPATAPRRPMPPLPPRGQIARLASPDSVKASLQSPSDVEPSPAIAAVATKTRTITTPRKIGSGRLIQARLTWKPGDPFNSDTPASRKNRFRWELMLSTACGTAVFGIGSFWLIHRIFS
jgi:hypothetical protein